MQSESKTLKSHLFVCTHQREEGASCGKLQSTELVQELKDWVKKQNLKSELKITRSGCLGECERGIAATCYPQGQWLTGLKKEDGEELKKLLSQSLA